MKRNWLLYLVIFSLALNLGTICAVAYLHYQNKQQAAWPRRPRPPGLHRLFRDLNLDPDQRQTLGRLFPPHRQKVFKLRKQLAEKRLELFELVKLSDPSPEDIAAKIKDICAAQENMQKEMVRFMLEVKKTLRPEQQERFINLLGRRLCPRLAGMGFRCPPGRLDHPGPGRCRGRDRGKGHRWGPPPGTPPQPAPPLAPPPAPPAGSGSGE